MNLLTVKLYSTKLFNPSLCLTTSPPPTLVLIQGFYGVHDTDVYSSVKMK